MKRKLKTIFTTIVFLTMAFIGQAQEQPAQKVQVAELSFEQLEPYLNRQSDTVYVVNFWATWCAPCVRELPYFERLAKEYDAKKLKVLLVSLDFPRQKESRLLPFIERMKLESEVVLLNAPNANAWIDKVNPEWSGAIPATLIYTREYRGFFEKELDYQTLESIVKPLFGI